MANDPKLRELTEDRRFRQRVDAVLDDLIRLGERPRIFEADRTIEEQRRKVLAGFSRTMNSFHVRDGNDGLARAADIADEKRGWSASKRFWMIIGASALARNLGWGGLFGLKAKQRRDLKHALQHLSALEWPKVDYPRYLRIKEVPENDRSEEQRAALVAFEYYKKPIGWDPAHLEDRDNWE